MTTKIFKTAMIVLTLLNITFGSFAQGTFTIAGQLSTDVNGQIVLFYRDKAGNNIKDSAQVVNGSFNFKGTLNGDPGLAYMELNHPKFGEIIDKPFDYQELYLDAGVYQIKGDKLFAEARITGGKVQSEYLALQDQSKVVDDRITELRKKMRQYKKETNDVGMQDVFTQMEPLTLEKNRIDSLFMENNPDSYVAFDIWVNNHLGVVNPDMEAGFRHFSNRLQKTERGQQISGRFEIAKRLDVGKLAPDFTLPDAEGKNFILSSLRGKNVFLFFWAPGAIGFENFIADMKRMNRRLSTRNVAMVGVYCDNPGVPESGSPEFWKSILAEFEIDWINVADMGSLNGAGAVSSTAKSYGLEFKTLFVSYLIGPDGKIIARNMSLSDKQLPAKIETIISKK